MILYHYTSTPSFNEITRTGQLNPSDPWTTMDAAYGHGWYFTDLAPDQCRAWTVAYCWRQLDIFARVDAYFKFEIPDGIATRCREHVYVVKQWDQQITYLGGAQTQKCTKSFSCLFCDVITSVVRPTLLYIWRPWTKSVPQVQSIQTPEDFGYGYRYNS